MSDVKYAIINTINQLIATTTGFENDSKEFHAAYDKISSQLQNYNTVYSATKKEIDVIIKSLGEKFALHGYLRQKKWLLEAYDKLVPEDDCSEETQNRLSVIKLLIELANSPTNNVSDCWESVSYEQEDVIDWGSYLLEGIERWSPPPDDSSESDDELAAENLEVDFPRSEVAQSTTRVIPDYHTKSCVITLEEARAKLKSSVQSGWFNSKKVFMKPETNDRAANLALEWQNHIEKITRCIEVDTPSIITEYHVIREIIWLMFVKCSCVCFKVVGDQLRPASNVTISSVRLPAFESFLQQFVPYMEYFDALRKFSDSLLILHDQRIPGTYRSYNCGVEAITKPMFELLMEIEKKVLKQESIYTLLVLVQDLAPIMPPLKLLHDILQNVILDYKEHPSVVCATRLLSHLYKKLFETKSKAEQDLYLTLYLHSLEMYFTIIGSWLGGEDLYDYAGEFPIAEDCEFEYLVREFDEDDPILHLITTRVLQIGRNIRLLRRLNKIQLFVEGLDGGDTETFKDLFVRKVLEQIATFFGVTVPEEPEDVVEEEEAPEYTFPGLRQDDCKYYTEMDKLENLVDTSDGFLMKAFESYFVKKPEKKEVVKPTLYARIKSLTQTFLPINNIITNVFIDILDERYNRLGFTVKNLLVNGYDLEKQFLFLQQIFLFKDDFIFPFYLHLFKGLDSGCYLENPMYLSSFLHDVIVDAYPKFYSKISVELDDDWKFTRDPVTACRKVNVKYRVEWPVTLIIKTEHITMYRELFQFILMIKWALYTLNHLYFADLEPKKHVKTSKSLKATLMKLKMLRFGLLNIFSSIQHYVMGHASPNFCLRFAKEVENAYNLESLANAHEDFISTFHKACCDLRDYEQGGHGFLLLLDIVRKLQLMWRNVHDDAYEELRRLEKSYWMCHERLNRVMNASRRFYDF